MTRSTSAHWYCRDCSAALCGHGVAALDVLHLAAAAHAVALVTPTLRVLPELNDPRLVSAIAHHVSQTLTDQHR